jgi:hypothetical protein
MKKDRFFIFSFFFTFLSMLVIFSSNIERTTSKKSPNIERIVPQRLPDKKEPVIIFERVNINRIKKLIDEEKLSDKEALFYKKIEE